MDALMTNDLQENNFGTIISKPIDSNSKYESRLKDYKESYKILESKNYNIISYDKKNQWKKEIEALIS